MYEIMPMNKRSGIRRTYDPFAWFDEMERAFFGSPTTTSSLGFKADIKDNGDSYDLAADMPGFDKDDIKVEVEDDVLTISAERNFQKDEKDDEGNYVRRERSYGSYSRSFDISNVDQDSIDVKYENGVLKMHMPKKAEETPTVRRLEIN
ncbi:MAG: Hsp20/alpha crystallin family protein [Coriobacteriales bacterium]|jgi:HSP20 family protein